MLNINKITSKLATTTRFKTYYMISSRGFEPEITGISKQLGKLNVGHGIYLSDDYGFVRDDNSHEEDVYKVSLNSDNILDITHCSSLYNVLSDLFIKFGLDLRQNHSILELIGGISSGVYSYLDYIEAIEHYCENHCPEQTGEVKEFLNKLINSYDIIKYSDGDKEILFCTTPNCLIVQLVQNLSQQKVFAANGIGFKLIRQMNNIETYEVIEDEEILGCVEFDGKHLKSCETAYFIDWEINQKVLSAFSQFKNRKITWAPYLIV